jgi:hypothetical protein
MLMTPQGHRFLASARKVLGDRAPDAARSTGHEGDLVGQAVGLEHLHVGS